MNRTAHDFLWDHILSMSAYWICTGVVVAKFTEFFALPLGISNFLTGLSSSFLALQLVGGVWYERTKAPRRFLLTWNMVWRICLMLVFLTVLLPADAGKACAVLLLTVMCAAFQLSNPAQMSWQVGQIEACADSRFYMVRDTGFMVVYTVSVCAVELLIATSERLDVLRLGFLCAAAAESVLLLTSIFFLFRLPSPVVHQRPPLSFRMLADPLLNPAFRPILWCNVCWSIAGVFGSGFSNLYAVRILHVDFIQIMIWIAMGNLLRAVFTPLANRLARKVGWKRCMELHVLLAAAIAVGWSLCSHENAFWTYPLLASVTSIPVAGFGLGLFHFQVQTIPEEERSVYLSVNSTVTGLFAILASAVCSGLVSAISSSPLSESGLRAIFWCGALLMLLTIFCLSRIRSDIRP